MPLRYSKKPGLLAACRCHFAHDAVPPPALSRRQVLSRVLSGGAAALAAAPGFGFQALAQAARPHRIDVHHHVVPPPDQQCLIGRKRSAETKEQGGGQNPPHEQRNRKRLEAHHPCSTPIQGTNVPINNCEFKAMELDSR